MVEMPKDFFEQVEQNGIRYIVKKDEFQKNHRAFDREKFSAFMPEYPGIVKILVMCLICRT